MYERPGIGEEATRWIPSECSRIWWAGEDGVGGGHMALHTKKGGPGKGREAGLLSLCGLLAAHGLEK